MLKKLMLLVSGAMIGAAATKIYIDCENEKSKKEESEKDFVYINIKSDDKKDANCHCNDGCNCDDSCNCGESCDCEDDCSCKAGESCHDVDIPEFAKHSKQENTENMLDKLQKGMKTASKNLEEVAETATTMIEEAKTAVEETTEETVEIAKEKLEKAQKRAKERLKRKKDAEKETQTNKTQEKLEPAQSEEIQETEVVAKEMSKSE